MKHTHKRNFVSIATAALVLVSLCAVCASPLSVSAAQGSSVNVQAPALVGAPVAGAPAVCSQNGLGLDLFVRDAYGALWWKHSPDGITWSKSTDLGGYLTSNPAATSTGTGNVAVFARGGDSALWSRSTTDGGVSWSKWSKIGGQLYAGTGPAAYVGGGAKIGLLVTGTDHVLYWRGPGSTSWRGLGGYLTSGPGATALTGGSEIGVIVGGANGILYYKHYASGAWSSWSKIGGQLLAGTSPAAYNWGTVRIGWFVTGTDNALYHMWAGTTSGSENLGGYLTSSPGATSRSPGTIDVFARGGSGDFTILWQRAYSHGQWGGWTPINGV